MKNTIILFFISLVGFLFVLQGCEDLSVGNDFLEKPPSVDVTQDSIFAKAEFAERFLWGAYESLPYGLPITWGDRTDEMGMDIQASLSDINHSFLNWGGVNQLYYSGQYTSGVENSNGKTKYSYNNSGAWDGIRDAHIFIENVDRVPDMTAEQASELKAEARMIKALHYTDMFRHFGGLPWIDRAYTANEDFNVPRMTSMATMDSIVATIDKAIPDLPFAIEDKLNWEGRFTQAAAMGLKARVLLFGASPLFNDNQPFMEGEAADKMMVWHGGFDSNLWKRAADAAKELIDKVEQTGDYSLVNTGNPEQDFKTAYYDRGNSELLISTRARYRAPGFWSGQFYFFQATRYGIGATTQNYVDMFPMMNGLSITDPNSGYDPDNPYENRDPRLYQTVLVNGAPYKNRQAELWIGGRERRNINTNSTASGYKLRKFILDENSATQSVIQWPYLRLAEIYLTYAEALNEFNDGPTPEAYLYVNKVRERAGVGELPQGLSKEEFRKAVLNERAIEFGYEKVRWFDIVRWKMDQNFTKTLEGMNIRKQGDGSFTYERFELPSRYWQDNWSPKWYLSAFPPNEINKGYGLVQNPGW